MKTQHIGPDELIVAAKVEFDPTISMPELAASIDAAEQALRAAVPIAKLVYLEPDIRHAGRRPTTGAICGGLHARHVDDLRGAHGISGLRGWLPPPTREPDPGNAGGGSMATVRHRRGGRPGVAPLDPGRRRTPPAGADRIVAADGGLDHARAAGLVPDVLVGDLDSVSADGLDWATANIPIERHPADKAATDTELALRLRRGDATRNASLLVAGRGDRLDHAIAALGALGADRSGRRRRRRGLVGLRPRARRPPRTPGRRRPAGRARRSRCSPSTDRAAA